MTEPHLQNSTFNAMMPSNEEPSTVVEHGIKTKITCTQ